MKNKLAFLLLIVISSVSCSRISTDTSIKGRIVNPSWMFGNARHFKDLGLVAIAAQYRLGNRKDIYVYECLDDARDVIKWIRANSDSLNIESDSIAAYGWSAGGHLAISAAIFKDSSKVRGIDSSPNAVILFSPAVSLPTNMSWIISALGYGADRKSINPVDHVRKGLPPTIILQGRDDTVTPLAEAQLFTDKMNESGNYCELIIYDNVGHLFTPNTINSPCLFYHRISPDIRNFLFRKFEQNSYFIRQG